MAVKYTLVGTMHVGVYIEVEAATREEAIAKAEGADVPRLCHQCASSEGRGWHLEDGLGDIVDVTGEDE